MKMEPILNYQSILRGITERTKWKSTFLADASVFAGLLAILYVLVASGRIWFAPFTPVANISSSPRVLPLYAAYSLVRISIAYVLSLLFALAYGMAAAKSERAAKIMLPLLDILQSIPVLSFLPGVMLAMVSLFPRRQLGLELGSVLLIFTGQAWNIAFSFYASVKGIPRELDEAARLYRFSRWQRFTELELPFAAIGLVWNSMMSVAGGWFFLMACEMFVLGARDFRLPGLGSFLQTAAGNGDTRAVLYGLAAMVGVIVLLDQLIWRPIIIWADKFKFEQVQDAKTKTSTILQLVGRAAFVIRAYRLLVRPLINWLTLSFAGGARKAGAVFSEHKRSRWARWLLGILGVAVILISAFAVFRGIGELSSLHRQDYLALLRSASFTFLRVHAALLLGALWTVPVGVAIGSSPRLSKIAQPMVQLAASIPATALLPILLVFLIRLRRGLKIAAMPLMPLGTQWYILFNVIAGAMAVPTDLKEVARIFCFTSWDRWRYLTLPAIFPYLITGMITASGGAWNASIIAEYFHFQGRIVSAPGIGSTISGASDSGRFDVLLASTLIMATIVVLMNRLVWRRLYRLASTRFKLET